VVGRFVVLALIAPAHGAVYTAYDPELDRNIALKLLHREPRRGQRARADPGEAQAMRGSVTPA